MQVLVVGAGAVGLAIAHAMALKGHEVIVAEAAAMIGTGVSSRNSCGLGGAQRPFVTVSVA